MTLDQDGAVRLDRAALSVLALLRDTADDLPPERAGIRIRDNDRLRPLLASAGALGCIATSVLGPESRPVRAILFDKTPDTNWALGWHQDRTIIVHQRIEHEGFGPWTVKAGMTHVEPPEELMAAMLTMRVHLDDVPEINAPLLIAPGSHLIGRIPELQVKTVVQRCGVISCLAEAGDVWLYATPILHASAAATGSAHRRVLQVDFVATDLPGGLEWLGV